MYSPREDFIYRPFAVAEPYGASRPMRYDLQRAGRALRRQLPSRDDRLGRRRAAAGPHARRRGGRLRLPDRRLRDAAARPGSPGRSPSGASPTTARVQDVVRDLREGKLQRVAFTMPGGGTWALPLYELALLARASSPSGESRAEALSSSRPRTRRCISSDEPRASGSGELLAERGIEVVTGAMPIDFDDGQLAVSPQATRRRRRGSQPAPDGGSQDRRRSSRPRRLRSGRRPRPGARDGARLRRRRRDDLSGQAGRRRHPAGRRGRGGDRSRARLRHRRRAARSDPARGALDRREASVPLGPSGRRTRRNVDRRRRRSVGGRRAGQARRPLPDAVPRRAQRGRPTSATVELSCEPSQPALRPNCLRNESQTEGAPQPRPSTW